MVGEYLEELVKLKRSGDAAERTYYPVLKELLEQAGAAQVKIEARHSAVGIPDLKVENAKGELIGYVEAKAPERSLDNLNAGENSQIEGYKKEYPNLIVTNFHEFRFFEEGKLTDAVKICEPEALDQAGVVPINGGHLEANLQKFLHTIVPQSKTSGQLAKLLAGRGRVLKKLIAEEIDLQDQIKTSTEELYAAFQKTLNPVMKPDEFADMYAQAIIFGLFTARLNFAGEGFDLHKASRTIPRSIPLLRKVFQVLSSADAPQYITWTIDDVAEILAKTDMEKIKKEFEATGKGKDPLFHFYEPFLAEYDPSKREKLGVYYTPLPVVNFITRAVQEILVKEFGKTEGFADTTVTTLDPAAGTMTFTAQAIALAHEKYLEKNGNGGWSERVEKHILKDFYAFELLMGPYTVGHLKIALMLSNLGYEMKEDDRFPLYLTNTLDMEKYELQPSAFDKVLTDESEDAYKIKGESPVLVVMGNPPYSGISTNNGKWISDQIDNYRYVDGEKMKERKLWIQDDYVKFLRFGQWKVEQCGSGILAFITNHAWLDNPTFRGMRQSLLNTFDQIYVLNLHGSHLKKEKTPEGGRDENVFAIQPGVAITIAIKGGKNKNKQVFYADEYGLQKEKYEFLENNSIGSVKWAKLVPRSNMYWLVPKDEKNSAEYQKFVSVKDIFPVNSTGILTGRDSFAIAFEKSELEARINDFLNPTFTDNQIMDKYDIKDKSNYKWFVSTSRNDLRKDPYKDEHYKQILYKPFDKRWIYYHSSIVFWPRQELMQHFVEENLALISTKQYKPESEEFGVYVTQCVGGHKAINVFDINYYFPLYVISNTDQGNLLGNKRPNIDFSKLPKDYEHRKPEDIFYYIYAVLYSPTYRKKYAEFLKTDFPRVPFTEDMKVFAKLSAIGEKLVNLHLLRDDNLLIQEHKYEGVGDNLVTDVKWVEEKVYVNPGQYIDRVGAEVWGYMVGGYQVLSKWLKDRKGRKLTEEERTTYRKIICSLEETIKIQEEIDKQLVDFGLFSG